MLPGKVIKSGLHISHFISFGTLFLQGRLVFTLHQLESRRGSATPLVWLVVVSILWHIGRLGAYLILCNSITTYVYLFRMYIIKVLHLIQGDIMPYSKTLKVLT